MIIYNISYEPGAKKQSIGKSLVAKMLKCSLWTGPAVPRASQIATRSPLFLACFSFVIAVNIIVIVIDIIIT